MAYRTFKKWLLSEYKDIFGFESGRHAATFHQKKKYTGAIDPIDSSIVLGELAKHSLGVKKPIWEWNDMIKWGSESGAIKIDVSPLGSYKIIVRKLIPDLEGVNRWVCKKIVPFDENEHNQDELNIALKLYEDLQKIDQELLDAPNHEYKLLERLTFKLADKVRQNLPTVMVFGGIKKMNENYYIIYNEYRGQGVEAPGSSRCENFHIHLNFNPSSGLIRCWGNEIQSPTSQHRWISQPSEWDEVFTPSQPIQEIVEAVIAALSTY